MSKSKSLSQEAPAVFSGGVVHKYARKLRKTDEGVTNLFKDVVVVDSEGECHAVPVVWGNSEKTKAMIIAENITSELDLNGKPKFKVDKIRLPVISVYSTDIRMSGSEPLVTYTVTAYTFYHEDMNQILEQVLMKFDNKKNCKLVNIDRNHDAEEDLSVKVLQSMFTITVEGIGVPVETHE